MRLLSKVALVTGSARGIGLAIAEAFVAGGAFVWLTEILDQEGQTNATRLGGQARYSHLDVRLEDDWRNVLAQVLARDGRLDILVNNAGITGFEGSGGAHDPEHARLEDWRQVHATNLDGVFLGCKHAIGAMRPRRAGSIINISSRSGIVGMGSAAAYASSKAAVRNHTKSVALYCAEQNLDIRCNSIHPAAVLTPMWEPMLGKGHDREQRMADLVSNTPLRRFGRPEEIAGLAVMLASDEVPYMTGAELHVDGGILAGSAASPKRG